MISTTFIHEFTVGDKAHSLFLKENVEIVMVTYYGTSPQPSIWYDVMNAKGALARVSDNDLIPLSNSASQTQTTNTNTYTAPTGGTYTYSGTLTGTSVSPSGTPGSVTFTLQQGFTLDPYAATNAINPTKENAKCECGAESVGSPSHSSWCAKQNSTTDFGGLDVY
jgi:hypothetical protein